MPTKNITESCSSTTAVLHTEMVRRQLHGSAPKGTPLARQRYPTCAARRLPLARPGSDDYYTVVPPKVPQPRGRGATGGLPFAIWLLADQLYHRRTSLWPIGYRHWHLQSQRHRKQAAQQYIREDRTGHYGSYSTNIVLTCMHSHTCTIYKSYVLNLIYTCTIIYNT